MKLKILHGKSIDNVKVIPPKSSPNWIEDKKIKFKPMTMKDPKIAVELYKLRGVGYYEIIEFGGNTKIKRYPTFKIIKKKGNTIYFKKII